MIKINFFRPYAFCFLFFIYAPCHAFSIDKSAYPFYVGIVGGYGSTTWQGLVPSAEHQGAAMNISTPKDAREGGIAGGIMAGYEFNDFFALEASYLRFPNAKLTFDPTSLVAFENDGMEELYTHTEAIVAMAKIMLEIPQSNMRAFSGFGAADVHRYDQLTESWKLSPTFSLGLNYQFNKHFMAELSLNYISGYGESEVNPAMTYVPFLYGAFLRLAYRFCL